MPFFLDNIVPMSYYMYSDDEQEVQMIGVEVTGGLKKDRELADEIVWWCMDMLMPRHRNLDITVKFTKTFEDGAQGFCYQGDDDRDFTIEIDHRLISVPLLRKSSLSASCMRWFTFGRVPLVGSKTSFGVDTKNSGSVKTVSIGTI